MARPIDPFREMERPFREMERLVNGLTPRATGTVSMPMNLYREGDVFVAEVELPGVDPASIDVDVEERTLTVRAERKEDPAREDRRWLTRERSAGTFARQLTLGEGLALDRIQADDSDGDGDSGSGGEGSDAESAGSADGEGLFAGDSDADATLVAAADGHRVVSLEEVGATGLLGLGARGLGELAAAPPRSAMPHSRSRASCRNQCTEQASEPSNTSRRRSDAASTSASVSEARPSSRPSSARS